MMCVYDYKKDLYSKIEYMFNLLKKHKINDIQINKRLINEGNKVKWSDGVSYELQCDGITIKATKISYYYDNENKFSKAFINTNYSIMCSDKADYYKIDYYLTVFRRIIEITIFLSNN